MQVFKKAILLGSFISTAAFAAPMADYSFKSPSFNGVGYSSHVLTIENQEFTRRAQVAKDIQAALDKAKADAANTNIAKFMNNLESRIYAQLSKQLADQMFSEGGVTQGTMNFQGTNIAWVNNGTDVTLTITQADGTQTVMTVPIGTFGF